MEDDGGSGAVIERIDVTARKRAEKRLAEQALRDPLTGLANRILLRDRLAHELEGLDRNPGSVAVLYCDLDGFKTVNDQLGHDAGDVLLRHVARRLRRVVRPTDTVSRPGGDEFVVVAPAVADTDVAQIADRIMEALSQPVVVRGVEINVGVSIGVASTTKRSADPTELLRDADTALYRAKRSGRGRWMRFRADMGHVATMRARTEQMLRRALRRGRIVAWLQPQWSLGDGLDVTAFEALARYVDPDGRAVSAGQFIEVAEETGLVRPLGQVVLRQACHHACRLREEFGHDDLRVWVNLSPAQLTPGDVVPGLLSLLESEGAPTSAIGVEITERAAITDPPRTHETLRQLREAGIEVAVDDFGAGHATFHVLRDLPLDYLKVDRMFVDGVDRHPYDRAVVRSVQELADTLGVETVAEGVERQSQLEALHEIGCQHAQGFLLGHPASIADTVAAYAG